MYEGFIKCIFYNPVFYHEIRNIRNLNNSECFRLVKQEFSEERYNEESAPTTGQTPDNLGP